MELGTTFLHEPQSPKPQPNPNRQRYLEQLAPCGHLLFVVEAVAGGVEGLVAEDATRNGRKRDAGGPELLGHYQRAEHGALDLRADGGEKVGGPSIVVLPGRSERVHDPFHALGPQPTYVATGYRAAPGSLRWQEQCQTAQH